jgi:hypothetical protein
MMKPPTRTTFATVPTPIFAPSAQATVTMTSPTQMFAAPNESGVCSAIPW